MQTKFDTGYWKWVNMLAVLYFYMFLFYKVDGSVIKTIMNIYIGCFNELHTK